MNQFKLDNERALITGGGSGIGRAIAESFIEAGAEVVITGRRAELLEETCSELGAKSAYYVSDVADYDANAKLLERIENELGPISILVNNAGVHQKKDALETSEEEFEQLMSVHVTGAFSLARHAAKGMIERGHGSILFIASMSSFMAIPSIVSYSSAKTAVLGTMRALAAEWSAQGVRVNAIAPGWIETAMSRKALNNAPDRKRKILERTPMNRLGQVEEIGTAATFLCSPAAGFITGACLPVDGGASVGF
ncbi:SDR family NAD(P)-dependent oxidoreductase [Pontiella agarivorans]|uniref:SDR family NAD(P)-dependent oxidoreductase n=1 Tax=Pontiella agarivorans TaxID=3038953 RepID=A0ABU5MS26_9BACT|nr:SDR family oxidoreductase [Pontiella agarivorans]MDZ8117014.1 SDR family NAD(P)-dependent oxidoreductase [Pontiella agarivorans]